ncbi:hypothetical protein [Schlesneria paludicola]|uniref:hypothetical protein n=1 Tax=Schlesneria paludicola TaxID=360056 RepID=UPI00029B571C|nr:hypothetical protein [Schlesneria paludicola]
MHLRRMLAVALSLSCPLIGCSQGDPSRIKDKVPLTKVTGAIMVDGNPTGGVILKYVPVGDIAEKREAYIKSFTVMTNNDGAFALKTYARGDGVPAGEYKLYCQYFPPEEQVKRRESGEDRFGGKYIPPKPPAKIITVKTGENLDVGTIELKSAPRKSR